MMTMTLTGCRTTEQRRARGTGLCWWDTGTEPWHPVGCVSMTNPSYLMRDPHHDTVWALHGDGCQASILADRPGAPVLATVALGGNNPVHLAQPRADLVLVACYASGVLSVLHLDDAGLPTGPAALVRLEGDAGPVANQQRGPHPHQVLLDPDGATVWVPDKGSDAVHEFRWASDAPTLAFVARHPMPAGSGPRHGVRVGDMLHLVEELSATLSSHRVGRGRLETVQRCSTRQDPGADSDCTASGIAVLPGGRHLVVSNRGDDSLAFFALDDHGVPQLVDVVASGVQGPRFILLDGARQELLVAGELSDDVVSIPVPQGLPAGPPRRVATTGSPTCVVVGVPDASRSAKEHS